MIDANPTRDQKVNAAKGIAYLYLNEKKWDDAKKYYRMASDLDPNDPEPYYSVGVIDWTACYQPRMEKRAALGMKPEENLNPEEQKPEESLRRIEGTECARHSRGHRQPQQSHPTPS